MSFSCKGYRENILTFKSDLTKVGVPVTIAGVSEVLQAPAEKDFIGITCYADGKMAGVIMDGYVEMPYTGTIPSFGYTYLVSDGSNGVKTPASTTTSKHNVIVLKLDTTKKIVGFIL